MPNGIYDIAIKTANKKKLTKFYTETMGFAIHHDCPQCAVLDMKNNQWLVIMPNKTFKPVKNPKTLRVTFGLAVGSVDAVYRSLKTKKVKFAGEPADQDWGARVATFYDPDGNEVDLIQEKPELSDQKKYSASEIKEPVAA